MLIGGLGADITLHRGIIEGLAQRHHVVAFDNRGAGRTDKPDADYTIKMMADDTVGLMKALSIQRAHILGISMGGRIALELALSHPDRVDMLILVSTSAAGRGKVSMSLPMRLLKPLQWIPVLRGKYPQPRYAHLRQRQATVSYNAAGRLSQLHTPALILHGRRDRSVPLDMAKDMAGGIAGSQLEVFGGTTCSVSFPNANSSSTESSGSSPADRSGCCPTPAGINAPVNPRRRRGEDCVRLGAWHRDRARAGAPDGRRHG